MSLITCLDKIALNKPDREAINAIASKLVKEGMSPVEILAAENKAINQYLSSVDSDLDNIASRASEMGAIIKQPDVVTAPQLTKEQSTIESDFREDISTDFPGAVEKYTNNPESKGGKVLNTDTARELSDIYLNDRTQSAAVHEPASEFIKKLYAERLAESPKIGEVPAVLFTAGGTGAGKSSAVNDLFITNDYQIVFDTNMNKVESADKKIQQALDAGKDVQIVMVYREPVEALVNGALPRAMKQEANFGSGRTVPIEEHVKTHVGATDTILKLSKKYADNESVQIQVIDNSRGKNDSRPVDIEFLENINYTGVDAKVREALENEFQKGTISESVYRGFKGTQEVPGIEQEGKQAAVEQPQQADPITLKQEDKDIRGSIQLFDESAVIKLHQASDLSSFLHESSHLFLEMEGRLSEGLELTKDQETILDFLGAKNFDEINVEQQEKFAETFEVYVREGKAPSLALRDAFAAFKRWLTRIYQSLADPRLGRAELNPEITEVFDRLLATEAEIEQARANPAYDQFFKSKEQSGMSDSEWDVYLKRVESARNRSQETLDVKLIKELTFRRTKEWKEEKQPLIEEETDRLLKEPVYAILSDTKNYPMDYNAVKEIMGFDKQPGRLIGKTKKDGVDPGEYAEVYGFANAEVMLDEMLSVPTLKNAANEAAEARMVEKYGDILNDGSIEAEAREAVHNEAQAELLLSELRALKPKGPKINRDYLKAEAKTIISAMKFSEIKPTKYYRAEIKAAKNAVTSTDKDQIFQYKIQQLANHYMYREAIDVRERMIKQSRYVKGVKSRSYNTKQVAPEYVQNMKALANLYDLRTNPEKALAISNILEWYQTQISDPNQFVDIQLLDEVLIKSLEAKQNGVLEDITIPTFDDLTASELQGLYDMLRHLRYVGGVMSDLGKAEFNATVEEITESILKEGGRDQKRVKGVPRRGEQIRRGFGHMVNKLPSLRNLTRKLDGFKSDVVHDAIYREVEKSNSEKIDLSRELYEKFNTELHDIYKIGLVRTDSKPYLLDSGLTFNIHTESRFMMALYWGTETSRTALRDGFGLTDGDVSRILADLTPKQLELVNAVWKVNESIWPELSSASVKMYGVAPPKLDATPFSVNGVEMRGGHMRLFYDSSELEMKTEREESGKMGSIMPTKAGSLHARVGSGGRPPLLDKNNISRSLEDNIHFVAFAETGRRIANIVNNKKVKTAIEQKHGEGFNKAFIENLENITGNRPQRESIPALAAMFRLLRKAATFKHLAYSVRNTMQQFSAIPVAMEEVGTVPFIGAITRFSSPAGHRDITDFVNQRSAFMRDRASLVNREASEYLRKVTVTGNVQHIWDQFGRFGFTPQTIVDATIAYPTWIAKYEQQFENHGDDKRASSEADTAVAESVGSGSDLHLGGVFQSNQSEFVRTMTLFGTWFNAYYQRMYKSTKGFTTADMEAARTILVTPFIVATLAQILIMDYPEDDSDEAWGEWAAKRYAVFMGGTIPLVRDIVGAFSGFSPKTVLGSGQETPYRFIKEFEAYAEGRQSGLKTVSDVTKVITTVVPVPGIGNITRVMDFVDSNAQGNETGNVVKKTYQALVEGTDKN